MQHNSVTLKVTIAGRLFIRVLVTLNSGNPERYREFIEHEYSTNVVREHTVDEIVASYQAIYDQTGGLDIFKVYATQRFSTISAVKAKNDGTLMLAQITVDDLQPHGILEFKIGAAPDNL